MVSEQRQNHIVTAGWLPSVLADVLYMAGNKLFMADIPMGVAAFRCYNMAIERPPLPASCVQTALHTAFGTIVQ